MNIKLQFKVDRRLGDPLVRIVLDDNMPSYSGPCLDAYDLTIPVIPGSHELRIQHFGKQNCDHLYDHQGLVTVDKHFELSALFFDDVELIEELWDGEFYPVYDQSYLDACSSKNISVPFSLKPNLYFGYNGTWVLTFEYPCVDWLIKIRNNKISKVRDPDFLTSEDELKKAKEFFSRAPDLPWDKDFVQK